jgi:hypothetical protein
VQEEDGVEAEMTFTACNDIDLCWNVYGIVTTVRSRFGLH